MMGSMMRRGSLGDGAALDLAFTSMNSTADLTAVGVTFTRSSSATYINSSGLLVVAGSNVARFDYDQTNVGTPKGLLIEGSATNLICHSETFASSGGSNNWTTSSATLSSLIFEDPKGTYTAPSLFASASNGTLLNNAGLSSAQRTFSIWLKRVSGTGNVQLTLDNSTWTTVTITPYWARYQITATSTGHVGIRLQTSGDGVHIFGAQLETGSGASSYIVTGTSTANRALDSCYIAGTNFTSWFSTGAGTVVAHSDNVCTVGQNTLCNFSDSTTANQIRMGDGTGGGSNELLLTVVGGSNQGIVDSSFNPVLNTAYKAAYAWDTNNFAICVNGGSVATDTGGTLAGAGVITSVTIGGDFYQNSGPNSVNMKNGHIRSWKYYPTRLSNAQLQALTT